MGSLTVRICYCDTSFVTYGYLRVRLTYQCLPGCYIGYERKSHWYCNKAYTGWHQPNNLSSNLVLYYSCNNLCYHAIKLLEQGLCS